MTDEFTPRRALARHVWMAAMEIRFFSRRLPQWMYRATVVAVWILVAAIFGLIVGLAAVVLPPTGAFGIVAATALVLLWVTPDLPIAPRRAIRATFFIMLVADICVPNYYTVQISGLPWISVRRLATFALIVPFLLAVGSSSGIRRRIVDRIRASKLMIICAVGFLTMTCFSIFTSITPNDTVSAIADSILSWYIPFFAVIYVIDDDEDILHLLRVICICAVFVALAGILEFARQHNFFIDIFPKSMLARLMADNPAFEKMVTTSPFRNGVYRASSIFSVSLSLAEFQVLVVPIAAFFITDSKKRFDNILGWAALLTGVTAILCSGARGGYISFLASCAVYVLLWTFRQRRANSHSLAPALVGLVGSIGFTGLIPLILFWRRANRFVLGDGAAQYSTQARYDQWALGWPHILSNPLTGHGFPLGANIIGAPSIDSGYLSLLVETGVPGFLFFVGLILLPIGYGLRRSVRDTSESGALCGALACSFIAFGVDRLVLSQRENHVLFFILVAVMILLRYFEREQTIKDKAKGASEAVRERRWTAARAAPALTRRP